MTPIVVQGWPEANAFLLRHLNAHRAWIESKVGPESGWAKFALGYRDGSSSNSFPLDEAATAVFDGDDPKPYDVVVQRLMAIIAKVVPHPACLLLNSINIERSNGKVTRVSSTPSSNAPGLYLDFKREDGSTFPAVLLNFEYVSGPEMAGDSEVSYLIVQRSDRDALFGLLQVALSRPNDAAPQLHTFEGNDSDEEDIDLRSWDSLILADHITTLVRRDIDVFYKREAWFKRHGFPFKRGHLYHGKPGNGKTSSVKCVLTQYNMDAYTLDLFSDKVSDSTMRSMFDAAAKAAPSMILLEDLDRAFPKTGETRCRLSMQSFLNCMDGVTPRNGVITVASANEPTALDPAILSRPGRFDRVVYFPDPDATLREAFFRRKLPNAPDSEMAAIVEATTDFSFSQLQEVYILGGQNSYDRDIEDPETEDLLWGASKLRTIDKEKSSASKDKGFAKGLAKGLKQ